MSSFSFKLHKSNFVSVLKKLDSYKVKTTNDNEMYSYRIFDCRVTIYKTYKLLIQGPEVDRVVDYLGLTTEESSKSSNYQNYIGCDEVGVGDYFGGLVTAAVYVTNETLTRLKTLGVCDSKKLSDNEMINMFQKIVEIVSYAVAEYTPAQYNSIIAKWSNTHIAKALLHNEAIQKLRNNIGQPECPVIMDQFASEKNYYSYLEKSNTKAEKINLFTTQAESKYIAVAAASIIARVCFLNQIKDLEKKLNHKIQLGASSSRVVEIARDIPKNKLSEFVKIDFSTTKKL